MTGSASKIPHSNTSEWAMSQTAGPRNSASKEDIQEAYRMLQVHPVDRQLLGIQWEGQLYNDVAIPFG